MASRQVFLKGAMRKAVNAGTALHQQSRPQIDDLQHLLGPGLAAIGGQRAQGLHEQALGNIGRRFAIAALLHLGMDLVSQFPQRPFQVHILDIGLLHQHPDIDLLLPARDSDRIPAPQQDIDDVFVEQGAGVGQLPLVGMHQGHHRKQQRIAGHAPQIGPAHGPLQFARLGLAILHNAHILQLSVPGGDEAIDLLRTEAGQLEGGPSMFIQTPALILITEHATGDEDGAVVSAGRGVDHLPHPLANFAFRSHLVQPVEEEHGFAIAQHFHQRVVKFSQLHFIQPGLQPGAQQRHLAFAALLPFQPGRQIA